jgi:hypothetical protein
MDSDGRLQNRPSQCHYFAAQNKEKQKIGDHTIAHDRTVQAWFNLFSPAPIHRRVLLSPVPKHLLKWSNQSEQDNLEYEANLTKSPSPSLSLSLSLSLFHCPHWLMRLKSNLQLSIKSHVTWTLVPFTQSRSIHVDCPDFVRRKRFPVPDLEAICSYKDEQQRVKTVNSAPNKAGAMYRTDDCDCEPPNQVIAWLTSESILKD